MKLTKEKLAQIKEHGQCQVPINATTLKELCEHPIHYYHGNKFEFKKGLVIEGHKVASIEPLPTNGNFKIFNINFE